MSEEYNLQDLPEPVPKVRDQGQMVSTGWQPENHTWLDILAPKDSEGCRQGLNPMELPLEVLSYSGHPRRRNVQEVKGAIRDITISNNIRSFTQLRQHCLSFCAEGQAEVRNCSCIECPVWQFRMGKNPHNPNRGKNKGINPFK